MPWSVCFNQTSQIVELVYTGRITARDMQESTSQAIVLGKEKGAKRFLVDARKMELAASLIDIYDLPTKQYVVEKADESARLALVPSSSPKLN